MKKESHQDVTTKLDDVRRFVKRRMERKERPFLIGIMGEATSGLAANHIFQVARIGEREKENLASYFDVKGQIMGLLL